MHSEGSWLKGSEKRALIFETVNHLILINKLQLYGIRDHILDWLKSYCVNQKQCDQFNDANSNPSLILYRAPQGYALGPLLFFYILIIIRVIFN